MRKIKLFGVLLLALTFGVVSVRAEETLQSKIDSATDGSVKLDKSYTESIIIPEGKEITIDLNGFNLTNIAGANTITVSKGATLTMKGEGTVTNVSNSKAPIWNDGTITIENGTYTRTDGDKNSFYVLLNHGTMTINGGEFIVNNGTSSLIDNGWYTPSQNTEKTMSTLTINGGTFTMNNNDKYIKNDDYGNMTVNGGKFVMNKPSSAVIANVGSYAGNETLIINNGEFVYGGNNIGTGYAIWDYKWSDDDHSITKVLGGTFTITAEGARITNAEIPEEVQEYEILDGERAGEIVVLDKDVEDNLEQETSIYEIDKEEIETEIKEAMEMYEKYKNGELEDLDEDDIKELESIKKIVDELDKYTIVGYYDINLNGVTEEGYAIARYEESEDPVELTLELPEDLPEVKEGFTRKYYVIRIHGDENEVTVIDDVTVDEDGNIKFKSDKFSTYVLGYNDVEDTKVEAPNTFDGIITYIVLSLVMTVLVGYTSLYLKKRFN